MATVRDVVVRKPVAAETAECQRWPIWSCEPSEFEWVYTQTEKCLLIEGQVTVTDLPPSGQSIRFGPGDYVIFP